MAQPAPKAVPDGTVNIDASGHVTVNNGTGPIYITNGQTSAILFTYEGGSAECELIIKFKKFSPEASRNGGMVQVGS
jgi:hypothetical protein